MILTFFSSKSQSSCILNHQVRHVLTRCLVTLEQRQMKLRSVLLKNDEADGAPILEDL